MPILGERLGGLLARSHELVVVETVNVVGHVLLDHHLERVERLVQLVVGNAALFGRGRAQIAQ